MLPLEDDAITAVRQILGPQLDYAGRALHEALVLVTPPIHFRQKKMYGAVVDMAVSLHVRNCRKFRQALLLTQIGQADGVDMLCRSMFEAVLAQAFICRPTVKLKQANGKPVDLFGQKLTQNFRAQLCAAHTFNRDETRYEGMGQKSGLKQMAAQGQKAGDPVYSAVKAAIGPQWWHKLKRSTTCAGLSVRGLAHSLGDGFARWYYAIYSLHSDQVHPAAFHRFIKLTKDGTNICWQDAAYELELALCYATFMMSLASGEFAKLLDKTYQPYIDAHMFDDETYPEFKKVYARVCPPTPPGKASS